MKKKRKEDLLFMYRTWPYIETVAWLFFLIVFLFLAIRSVVLVETDRDIMIQSVTVLLISIGFFVQMRLNKLNRPIVNSIKKDYYDEKTVSGVIDRVNPHFVTMGSGGMRNYYKVSVDGEFYFACKGRYRTGMKIKITYIESSKVAISIEGI